jgi:MFS family permease
MPVNEPAPTPQRLTGTHWLILAIASLGFAFDIYELLVMPLIARPALAALLGVDPDTDSGFKAILAWNAYIMWGSAICGGVFGLLGGWLTDRLGRRRVLTWSILLYAFSALAAGFSTSAPMLLFFRCTTFIGVCVEFVAAVAWLAELFPQPRRREAVLGYTQAFSSVGGLLVTVAYGFCNYYRDDLPAIFGAHEPWRYTLISGVIPALPLIIIRPFLPESPIWEEKRAKGLLKRPRIAALFAPELRRTTLATTVIFACSYGAAFGAIQFTPQIVPGLKAEWSQLARLRPELEAAMQTHGGESAEARTLKERIQALDKDQQSVVKDVQLWQEFGGLAGRFALAWLALRIVSRRCLLRAFQIPGLIIMPLVFLFPAAGKVPEGILEALGTTNLGLFKIGIFLAGFFTVAQFSFWGNYLPRVYPVHIRGTGESFAANIGGRMIGTSANALTGLLLGPLMLSSLSGLTRPGSLAYAAAGTALLVYAVGLAASFFLPEPERSETKD